MADAEARHDEGSMNLTKYLSTSGVASRRHSAELIKAGKVMLNGKVETNPGMRVMPGDEVVFEGKAVKAKSQAARHYIMLNKPRGYVCTSEDIHAEKKAVDLIRLKDGARLFSAGRLDKNSEGLILFSDDGDFVEQLTHPSHEVEKTYEISTDEPLTEADVKRLLHGISSAGDLLRALAVNRLGPCKYELVLGEGKNREIRRMMDTLGRKTKRLKRTAVGLLRIGGLDVGEWRELTEAERSLAGRKSMAGTR